MIKPLSFSGQKQTFTILQFTDLHLMDQPSDELCYDLFRKLLESEKPDFLVITGDLTMHPQAGKLLQKLKEVLEPFQIPYGFVFGNHDNESMLSKSELAQIMTGSDWCRFENGTLPDGVGNYHIDIEKDNVILFRMIFLDSHNDRIDIINSQSQWSYDYLKPSQLEYVDRLLTKDQAKALLFFHIPLPEMNEYQTFEGVRNETVCSSKINSGMFSLLKARKKCLGVFCGHDHYNDYSFEKDGIVLAYGRVSGYFDYLDLPFQRGARKIVLYPDGTMKTSIVLVDRS